MLFPSELQLRIEKSARTKSIKPTQIFAPLDSDNCDQWMRPTNLEQLLTIKSKYPDAKLVCGNSEIGKKCGHGTIKLKSAA